MRDKRALLAGAVATTFIATASALAASEPIVVTSDEQASVMDEFVKLHPNNGLFLDDFGRVRKVYGPAVAFGASPIDTAEQVRTEWSSMFGAAGDEVVAGSTAEFVPHEQPLMYDAATDSYRFTLVSYHHERQGVDVFGSRLTVLVRNEPGYPAVLVTSTVRNIRDHQPAFADMVGEPEVPARAVAELSRSETGEKLEAPTITDVRRVIWAGTYDVPAPPRDAIAFVAERGVPWEPAGYTRKLHLVDARTGASIWAESLVHENIDISVAARVTEGIGSAECEPEVLTGLPYARVTSSVGTFFADANGDVNVPAFAEVDVTSEVRGEFFRVFNEGGSNGSITQTVVPGEANQIVHNDANNSELVRAEVNAYVGANTVRDYYLALNPAYPVIGGQTEFAVNVNIGDNCNAFYNGSSINFFTSGGGCPNTAFDSVTYHEYGHHLVNVGGSGQGAYGEGMSDTVSALILDDPRLGLGFFGNCNSPLRNADNDCQYSASSCSSCGSAIHSCGQLLSGSVWDTYQFLSGLGGGDAREIVSALTLNSIMLHNGTSIDPQITIDFLTLDDDDADILNGTPNYSAIAAGFGAHGLDAPPLALLGFEFPAGLPEFTSPAGTTTARVIVTPITGAPVDGEASLFYREGTSGGFTELPLVATGNANEYDIAFPAADCGATLEYYVAADTTGGQVETFPRNAPTERLSTAAAFGVDVRFDDDFELDQGWTVQNFGGLSDGAWERGVPAGGGDRGDPAADYDGSGRAFVTDNADGNSDVDDGGTRLVSPVMDATGLPRLAYARWYSNTEGSNPNADVFDVEVSDNGGATWTLLEQVGPGGPEADGGWYEKSFNLSDLSGFALNDQFRVRFTASDLGGGSVVEAGVDAVRLEELQCEPDGVPGDLDGDGSIGFGDLVILLAAWGPCDGSPCPADLDGSGAVDFPDLVELLAAWEV